LSASYGAYYEPHRAGGFAEVERELFGPLTAFSKAYGAYDFKSERSVYGAAGGLKWRF